MIKKWYLLTYGHMKTLVEIIEYHDKFRKIDTNQDLIEIVNISCTIGNSSEKLLI